jgi:hypothetical protein
MNTLITGLIILALAIWFAYCVKRMWKSATSRSCESCSLASEFQYGSRHRKTNHSAARMTMVNGHPIILDEKAARARRERLRRLSGQA